MTIAVEDEAVLTVMSPSRPSGEPTSVRVFPMPERSSGRIEEQAPAGSGNTQICRKCTGSDFE
jgi:hypothetical protein